jgi:hypothetical protein
MDKKLMFITVRGNRSVWGFPFYGDPQYLSEWRADGLDVILIENTVPALIAELGLTRLWCFAQDLFGFRNPWRSR